ncbi:MULTISPECIES: succinyldiaminopimelate transaminase [Micrococcaceae]|uniref:succinyldiaminopimelate transaminase n=1 Tax=Micrococcaceae TaxID=1268 RepID=UPI001386083A|nr:MULTISPECIES: succinyldiaminopimelate transaminase [Pseudarthrobacter]MEA3549826.1 succinyldiaminopimelate transaminase [Pseudarthrobacter sp. C1]MUU72817.1 succinyldiaminopimelate transaminase [Pseudarthrobacter sp. GA104]WPU08222.1 succinyldiaminopimelate transaminase [Pseudarthrobacter oxydans]HET7784137.1 succinyldiaminopimelate transaminase [Arthrobacter sp.]
MTAAARTFGLDLPDYPWEAMAPYVAKAGQHPDGAVNLSIGTPVDPTPALIQDALKAAADAPGYPTVHGTPALREAIAGWFERRRGVTGLDPRNIMPTVGSKELVAWLPLLLGLKPGDVVVRPKVAYPTYDIGATLAGAASVATDNLDELDDETRARVRLIWVNSPGNPTGSVRGVESLKALVEQARGLGAVVASDECYAELGWGDWDVQRGGQAVPSILDPRVAGGSHRGLLAVYSLSKQSNVAGYRAAFVAGDPDLMPNLVNSRKHAGMIVPYPVQEAMRVALGDDAHVEAQKDLYRGRRDRLVPALLDFGLEIKDSDAGLYLWSTAGESTWDTVARLAERGIVVGPGVFYGEAGNGYIRVALTGSDERIDAAVSRLAAARQ